MCSSSAPVTARPSAAMPSSIAITPAVLGWSPVIITGRIPALFARATASFASSLGGIDHADEAREHEVLLGTFLSTLGLRHRVRRQLAVGDAERPSARPASSSFTLRISARRSGAQAARLLADVLPDEQRSRSTSGAPFVNTISRSSSSVSVWTVLMSLRSDENGTSPTRRTVPSSAFPVEAGLARRDQQRALGRIALHRPAAFVLLHDGVVRAIGDGERPLQLEAKRAIDCAAAVAADLALGRVARAGEG